METKHVVYAIFNIDLPDTIRYVGMTSKGEDWRFRGHWKDVRRGRKTKVHNWMRKYGPQQVGIRVIEVYGSREDCVRGEIEWIAKLREIGQADLNLTDGGEGTYGFKHSDEYRKKRSEWMKAHPIRVEFTEEMRRAIGESNRRRLSTPEAKREHANRTGKLREHQVVEIKERIARGDSHYRIAEDFGISYTSINNISRDHTWSHVPWPFGPRNISCDNLPENRSRGEKRSKKGLTEEDILNIREAARSRSYAQVGKDYGLSAAGVYAIVIGRTWAHVPMSEAPERDPERIHKDAISGESNKMSKLTEEAVRDIRESFSRGESFASMARRFKVSETAVSKVAKGETWKHVV